MNIKSEARRDAFELARAQMYYGEGAGVRRRLIEATTRAKVERNPEYAKAFREELAKQDMADHAEKARKERRRRDVKENLTKDAKKLSKGDYSNLRNWALVLAFYAWIAHKNGQDKVVLEKGKELFGKAKDRVKVWRREGVVYNITVVPPADEMKEGS